MKNKALFLDRDGVVNNVIMKEGGPCAPWAMEEFSIFAGAATAIEKAKKLGFLVIICTNQPDVPRGLVKKEIVENMHTRIKEKLRVDDIFVCFHDNNDRCRCRKPKAGLLLDAAKKWDIDLKASFFVGDTWRDVLAGKNADCKTILIRKDYNKMNLQDSDYLADDLVSAVNLLADIVKKEAVKAT